jgi:putative Holliday junction resolvase
VRLLGLDVGTRRIGVALSDDLGLAAHALTTRRRTGNARDADVVAALVAEHGAAAVVVGLPEGSAEEGRVRGFVGVLRTRLACPVHTVDESFTTSQAEAVLVEAGLSRRRRRNVVDRLAAAEILDRYLDQTRVDAAGKVRR